VDLWHLFLNSPRIYTSQRQSNPNFIFKSCSLADSAPHPLYTIYITKCPQKCTKQNAILSICRLSVCLPVAWLPAACLPVFLPYIKLVPYMTGKNSFFANNSWLSFQSRHVKYLNTSIFSLAAGPTCWPSPPARQIISEQCTHEQNFKIYTCRLSICRLSVCPPPCRLSSPYLF
jgi:hypothetical protein